MKNNSFKNISLSIINTWFLFFCIIPLSLILVLCFFSSNDSAIFSLPLTLNNFKLLSNPFFYKVVWRSLLTASLATLICFSIAYPFSYLISKTKYKEIFLFLILIPFWTSALIRTYALIGLLKTHGLINNFLLYINIIKQPLDLLYNQTAVLIGLSYNLLPFMILPLYNTFNKLDPNLIHAAQDLNAHRYYIFKKIIWPLTVPGVKKQPSNCLFPGNDNLLYSNHFRWRKIITLRQFN